MFNSQSNLHQVDIRNNYIVIKNRNKIVVVGDDC